MKVSCDRKGLYDVRETGKKVSDRKNDVGHIGMTVGEVIGNAN